MLGPFATASRRTRHSPGVASDAARASMSTTTPTTPTTTTTTTRDRGDRYGPMEWAQRDKSYTWAPIKPTANSHRPTRDNSTVELCRVGRRVLAITLSVSSVRVRRMNDGNCVLLHAVHNGCITHVGESNQIEKNAECAMCKSN